MTPDLRYREDRTDLPPPTPSLSSGRLVLRVGATSLVRYGAAYAVLVALLLGIVGITTDGRRPPLGLFLLTGAVMLPSVTALVSKPSATAVAPLGHIAGMAAAIISTIFTIGGVGALVVLRRTLGSTGRTYCHYFSRNGWPMWTHVGPINAMLTAEVRPAVVTLTWEGSGAFSQALTWTRRPCVAEWPATSPNSGYRVVARCKGFFTYVRNASRPSVSSVA